MSSLAGRKRLKELFYREVYKDQTVELEGRQVWKTDGTPYEGQIGDGYYMVKILDESGKVDINTASELVLKNLFINAGVKPEEADIIVDCIKDWKDGDDLHRLHGAESDYYMSLLNPYRAKDDKFDAIEELLLVKGMTADILYGGGGKKGIIDFLTVHSGTESININAAPKEVLMVLPGMTPEYADSIIEYRKTKEINDLSEIGLSGEGIELIMPEIDTQGLRLREHCGDRPWQRLADALRPHGYLQRGVRAERFPGRTPRSAIGSTGASSGSHIHFEMLHDDYGKVNPWDFLP